MSKNRQDAIVVDISEILTVLTRRGKDKFNPCVYETWLARMYTKAHAIPCISATILSRLDNPLTSFARQREVLENNAKRLAYDPLSVLPTVPWAKDDQASVWFFVKGNFLMMGTGRAIKTGWGDLYRRVS